MLFSKLRLFRELAASSVSAGNISSEEIIKYAHRISASNAVCAPLNWVPGRNQGLTQEHSEMFYQHAPQVTLGDPTRPTWRCEAACSVTWPTCHPMALTDTCRETPWQLGGFQVSSRQDWLL